MTTNRARLTLDALDDLGIESLITQPAFEHLASDDIEVTIDEYCRFMDEVMAPTARAGDTVGCRFDPESGRISTPPGFTNAYAQFVDAGWATVPLDRTMGGGGFPQLVGIAMQEIFASANLGLSLCAALTQSTVDLLTHWGTDAQRDAHLPKLATGEWNGTMWITESDAGSDVGAISTLAHRQEDGTYRLNGTKIFISWGEHDLTDNTIHMVLARTPGAPPGTKGLSLFLVPKYLSTRDIGGTTNGITCIALEEKLGLHGSPTTVMELNDAVGELIGGEGEGMRAMFTMMNSARLAIGLQGLSIGEAAYDAAVQFSAERVQGYRREPGDGTPTAVTIDHHPDVRHMLARMRSDLDAMRQVVYLTALNTDLARLGDERAQEMVDLLTPIAKAWVTDLGVEIASLSIQIHGGMGYMEDTDAPRFLRDARIGPIYEGTNGIQAIDLVTRKLPIRDGDLMDELFRSIRDTAQSVSDLGDSGQGSHIANILSREVDLVQSATIWLVERRAGDPDDVLAGATPYLAALGDLIGGWLLALRAVRHAGIGSPSASRTLDVAHFYALERLGRASQRLAAITAGAERLFV